MDKTGAFIRSWAGPQIEAPFDQSFERRAAGIGIEKKRIERDVISNSGRMYPAPEEDFGIGEYIISCLDDNGWLDATPEEIAADLRVEPAQVCRVLSVIQGFDPPGIAARDLRECLLIQICAQQGEAAIVLRRRQLTAAEATAGEETSGTPEPAAVQEGPGQTDVFSIATHAYINPLNDATKGM